jgi:GntR family transcriptional regulator/MocR family aminotransferase
MWSRLVARRERRMAVALLAYGDPAGYRPLRDATTAHVSAARGVPLTADQVIVVAGAQQALEFAVRMLLHPGDPAWIEDPGYRQLLRVDSG